MTTIFTAPNHKVAIVTGGARGIGAAIATRLAADGHHVAVFDLDADACAETVERIETAGRRALALAVDVSNEDAVVAGVARVAEELGAPTVLVNNAGILRDRTLAKMTLDDWEVVMAVNLRSVFLMCRAVQPHMRSARWGRIVNLSSTAALGVIGESNYSAAKAGVQGITRTLAIELGRHGITVNAVAPGFVVTDMTRAVAARMNMPFEDMVTDMMTGIYVGRPGVPDDIAQAVAFFTDERSGFVTGQVLYVAGAPRA
ncbi:SDR family oxidoreductase [Sphingomonas psychrolutea]|uniref:3-oxoacyl-ACP reductase n=1 Tax=Sphingomonas psychrolutea TaxID=1259676 RepID=A0ABQ1H710_9SPHN|nr:SDR family oxidoreductase [Sphingomonas psychrolutea]GGA61568.1 3-oxoacyl-ACP reductase [Sphingomonas psychrolutea]